MSRSATTDMVASGFNPMYKNERASSRSATNDINPKYALTLIVHYIGRAAGTYIRIFIYVHRVWLRRICDFNPMNENKTTADKVP